MEVIDFGGTHSAHSIGELEQLLGVRFKDQRNHYWLRADGSDFPRLSIAVNGDLSEIHYFPKDRHPGYLSIGGRLNLDPDKMTTFSVGPSRSHDIQTGNEFVISFAEAMKVAKEFFHSQELPRSIEWVEL
jgi:hypothetical protein